MPARACIDVHFAVPPFGPYTYEIDGVIPTPGTRVEVELGRRVVVGLAGRETAPPAARVSLKPLLRILDYDLFVPPDVWELAEFTSRRYASSLGEAIRLAVPVPLDTARDDQLVLTAAFAAAAELGSFDDEERAVLEAVWEAGWLGARAAGSRTAVARLVARGVLAVEAYTSKPALADLRLYQTAGTAARLGEAARRVRDEIASGPKAAAPYFTDVKRRAAARRLLRARLAALALTAPPVIPVQVRAAEMLFTGGDDEGRVADALARVKAAGARGVVVVVPEIFRISGVLRTCEDAWGEGFTAYASELSPAARWEVFRRCRRGAVTAVVGTRSALFLPAPAVRAVVVVDEGDHAYKQFERAPLYHVREVAAARARGAPLVYVSSAPSLEAYAATLTGEIARAHLPPAARRSAVEVIDMVKVLAAEGPVILSAALTGALAETLAAGRRAVILVNRRGYVPFLSCRTCGRALACGRCEVAFTYHKDEEVLRCHYCLRREPMPPRCPSCGKETLVGVGFGAEKLYDEVKLLFPAARVTRVDSDALKTAARARARWEEIGRGGYDVIVGTQMAARACDDGAVALAALASADTALTLPDFRATEWTYRLIRRMAEGGPPGRRVLIQTLYPGHYAVVAAAAGDFDAFAREELAFRKRLNLPPYCRLVNVVVEARGRAEAERGATTAGQRLKELWANEGEVLGPVPAPLPRLRGAYRYQILIKTTVPAITAKGEELAALAKQKGRVRITVDVDPYELM